VSALDEAAGDRPEERVSLRDAPNSERQPTARSQDPPRFGHRSRGIDHEHVPEPAQHAVDRVVGQLDPLGVDDAVVDVRDPRARRPAGAPLRASSERNRT
jgi:hypothetical protein